jgi:hypothetical protein
MRWIDNHGWARATMVTRFNKLLYRDVSDDFPQTPDGYPDWQEKAAIEFEQKGAAQNAAK